ncbi:hypothetical protein [Shouchella clausii]|uniref:hypothetical protein n=1 Tax=Shouchella clausii TaxID=79880 RepID=UPI001C73861D|nr:hypothetical protein [Shouchella clausii]MBX0320110.1 hypothetical protein [Shouchella clausii]
MTEQLATRIKKMREADELLYRDDQDTWHSAKEIIMYGGEDQVLLDCFGPWKLVKFEDVFLPSEVYGID